MIEEMVEMGETILKQDQLFTLGAKILKKTVDALVTEGFTREEAIQIAAAQGPMVKGNR